MADPSASNPPVRPETPLDNARGCLIVTIPAALLFLLIAGGVILFADSPDEDSMVGFVVLLAVEAVLAIVLAAFYALYVLLRVNLNPKLAPTAKEVEAMTGRSNKLSRARMNAVLLCIALIGAVMGSIYGGIASVTEAAAVGCIGAMVVAAVRHEMKWPVLQAALVGSMTTVGTIIWLILGAISFVGIFNLVGGGDFMRSLFLDLGWQRGFWTITIAHVLFCTSFVAVTVKAGNNHPPGFGPGEGELFILDTALTQADLVDLPFS